MLWFLNKISWKFIPFIFSLVFICNDLVSQEEFFWLYGGSGVEEGRSLIQTPAGGYMVGGRTRSFGSGSEDYYLIGVNTQFDVFIDQPYGGPHHDRCQSMVSLGNGTYGLFGQPCDFLGGRLNLILP